MAILPIQARPPPPRRTLQIRPRRRRTSSRGRVDHPHAQGRDVRLYEHVERLLYDGEADVGDGGEGEGAGTGGGGGGVEGLRD